MIDQEVKAILENLITDIEEERISDKEIIQTIEELLQESLPKWESLENIQIWEIENAQEALEWILNKWDKDITHVGQILGRIEAAEYLLRKFLIRKGDDEDETR